MLQKLWLKWGQIAPYVVLASFAVIMFTPFGFWPLWLSHTAMLVALPAVLTIFKL
jgi:hypothetical protein